MAEKIRLPELPPSYQWNIDLNTKADYVVEVYRSRPVSGYADPVYDEDMIVSTRVRNSSASSVISLQSEVDAIAEAIWRGYPNLTSTENNE